MSKIKIELVEECPDCGCKVLETGQDGFVACRDCGLVVEADIIDYGPEWRNFEDGSGKNQGNDSGKERWRRWTSKKYFKMG